MSPAFLVEHARNALLLSLAVVAALVILGPWMGSQIGAFAERMLLLAATSAR